MKKRNFWIFLLIFILGFAAGMVISNMVRRNAVITSNTATESSLEEPGSFRHDQSLSENPSVAISENDVPASTYNTLQTYPEWEKSATYTGGDKVIYNGKQYRAKWWTLGEIPGQSDVWEDTLEMSAQPDTAPESASAVKVVNPAHNATRTTDKETEDHAGLKIVGYYPDWKVYQPEKLRFDLLTHVNYAFAIPTQEGGIRPLEHPDTASRLIADAHKEQLKVLLAVGGWSYNESELEPVFVSATSTSEKITQFGDSILALCDQYGFDGVDMDWEHPRMDGPSKDQYQQLMLYLAGKLHAKGKILTSAVISGVSPEGSIYYDAAAHSDAVLSAVDWINVMAYDGGDGERHSSYDFAVNCSAYWCDTRNMPREKVVLGVPFYGRPGWASYEDIIAADPDAGNKDHTTINGIDAHYNGIAAMEQKAEYAKDNLGGIMIWELTQDTADRDKSLLSAIGRGIQ